MPDLEDLYREIVLDHYKSPRNRGELDPPAVSAEGFNPLCGDEVVVYVLMEDDRVADISFGGQGCSISQSSASMMSAAVKGMTVDEITDLTARFKAMLSVTDNPDDEVPEPPPPGTMGEIEALKGVIKFPTRIKCATLSWNTLFQAIEEASAPAADE